VTLGIEGSQAVVRWAVIHHERTDGEGNLQRFRHKSSHPTPVSPALPSHCAVVSIVALVAGAGIEAAGLRKRATARRKFPGNLGWRICGFNGNSGEIRSLLE
jgi:hypothetical protein